MCTSMFHFSSSHLMEGTEKKNLHSVASSCSIPPHLLPLSETNEEAMYSMQTGVKGVESKCVHELQKNSRLNTSLLSCFFVSSPSSSPDPSSLLQQQPVVCSNHRPPPPSPRLHPHTGAETGALPIHMCTCVFFELPVS